MTADRHKIIQNSRISKLECKLNIYVRNSTEIDGKCQRQLGMVGHACNGDYSRI
jgi:hypothetical protein